MLSITDTLSIDERELHEEFVRSAGPGGQNVNKVETAVQLRFDAAASPSLPDDVRTRLLALAGKRATAEGVVVITARTKRTQAENRAAALATLTDLLRRAAAPPPPPRRKRRPSAAARATRLEGKRRRSEVKQSRQRPAPGVE